MSSEHERRALVGLLVSILVATGILLISPTGSEPIDVALEDLQGRAASELQVDGESVQRNRIRQRSTLDGPSVRLLMDATGQPCAKLRMLVTLDESPGYSQRVETDDRGITRVPAGEVTFAPVDSPADFEPFTASIPNDDSCTDVEIATIGYVDVEVVDLLAGDFLELQIVDTRNVLRGSIVAQDDASALETIVRRIERSGTTRIQVPTGFWHVYATHDRPLEVTPKHPSWQNVVEDGRVGIAPRLDACPMSSRLSIGRGEVGAVRIDLVRAAALFVDLGELEGFEEVRVELFRHSTPRPDFLILAPSGHQVVSPESGASVGFAELIPGDYDIRTMGRRTASDGTSDEYLFSLLTRELVPGNNIAYAAAGIGPYQLTILAGDLPVEDWYLKTQDSSVGLSSLWQVEVFRALRLRTEVRGLPHYAGKLWVNKVSTNPLPSPKIEFDLRSSATIDLR